MDPPILPRGNNINFDEGDEMKKDCKLMRVVEGFGGFPRLHRRDYEGYVSRWRELTRGRNSLFPNSSP